jgi:hypothetical protein
VEGKSFDLPKLRIRFGAVGLSHRRKAQERNCRQSYAGSE